MIHARLSGDSRLVALCLVLAVAAGGCAGPAEPRTGSELVSQAGEDADRMGDSPGASTALLTVYGMSCPLCANNVDKELAEVPGVRSADVDMGTGLVTVGLDAQNPPPRAALARAVERSGFTLKSIEVR